MEIPRPVVLLFRCHDLRTRDNAALAYLASLGRPIVPLFIWSEEEQGKWGVRGAARVYLESALEGLDQSLASKSLTLIKRKAKSTAAACASLCAEINADIVAYHKEYTPEGDRREVELRNALASAGAVCQSFEGLLLYDVEVIYSYIRKGFQGGHWGILMPFLRTCEGSHCKIKRPFDVPGELLPFQDSEIKSDDICDLGITSGQKWEAKIRAAAWPADELSAYEACEQFVHTGLKRYERERSRADKTGSTSRLSMMLRFGVLSPRDLYYSLRSTILSRQEIKTFSRRLHWRDLAYFHLLCFPFMRDTCIRKHYEDVAWVEGDEKVRRLTAWKKGKTGFPIVDAGMRELYATGFQNQSIRMVCASFLVEYLRIDWKEGEAWFHDTLIDADPAINAMMWQMQEHQVSISGILFRRRQLPRRTQQELIRASGLGNSSMCPKILAQTFGPRLAQCSKKLESRSVFRTQIVLSLMHPKSDDCEPRQ